MAKIGIAGASGYTGLELIRLLINHPEAEIAFLTSETYQGEAISKVFPSISGFANIKLSSIESISSDNCEIVFLALPHTTSMEKVPSFLKERNRRILVLGSNFGGNPCSVQSSTEIFARGAAILPAENPKIFACGAAILAAKTLGLSPAALRF